MISNFMCEAIKGATAAYAHPLGLKTSTTFLSRLNQGQANWSVDRTENYAYDADFDYLTSVDYNDGLANEVQSWSYDAAGNRVSDSAKPGTWTYDNLNRMSGSPMASYTHDAVGNRLTKVSGGNTTSYSWDAVNRMIEAGPVSGSRNSYKYRADGMRVRKEIPGLVEKVYYDGQMPVETFEDFSTGNDKLTRNFVGARGIEMMETTVSGVTTQAYPLYDTHGNMVATLSKNTAGTSWSLGNERSYDVWGSVRSGVTTGGPKGRYVANLGHVQDDESGLNYMRARYYEPETGRFVSQDAAKIGHNWFSYADNLPTVKIDQTGRYSHWFYAGAAVYTLGILQSLFAGALLIINNTPTGVIEAIKAASIAVILIGLGVSLISIGVSQENENLNASVAIGGVLIEVLFANLIKQITPMAIETAMIGKTHTAKAGLALFAYSLLCFGYLVSMEFD
ncbi:hypothetical protein C0431_14415 [bacterium]|nr:hypothetical protein [bacterium]